MYSSDFCFRHKRDGEIHFQVLLELGESFDICLRGRVVTRVTFNCDHIDATSPRPLAPPFNMLRSRLAAFFLFPLLSSAFEQTVMSKAQPGVSYTTQTLADLLTIESSASIFYDYARGVNLGNKLNDKSSMITVLVPMNKAVMKLARKP